MRLKNNWVVIATGLLASVLASALLLDLRSTFYLDWNNHLWLIEYFGASIKHLCIPDMVNTRQLIGIPNPLFYGQKFYVLAGMLSAFLGSAVTVRIMVFMVFLLQFFQVYRAAMKAGGARNISIGIAVLMTWAIYPLTNLYNRSALTEFFAVAFLTCSLASFLCVIIHDRQKPVSRYDIIASGLFFVLAAVTHPLTALFGGLFLGILGVIALIFCERERKLWLLSYFAITALLSLLILSPWLYVLAQFNNKLPIGAHTTTQFYGSGFFPNSVDNILSRVSPLPLDLRSIEKGIHDVITPYLDAQIALPLILLMGVFIYVGWREKSIKSDLGAYERTILGGSAFMLTVCFAVSVCPKVSGWFGGFFDILQFPFRLTSYVNLSALVILIILAGRISRANVHSQQVINVCLAFCIAIAFSGLMLKLVHASVIRQDSTQVDGGSWAPLPFGSNSHLNDLPGSFYGAGDYSVANGFAKDTFSNEVPVIFRNFKILDGARFGQVGPLTVNLNKAAIVVTNIQPFPWNRILINGSLQSQSDVTLLAGREAVLLPSGSYILKATTRMDGVWKFLNLVSWVLLLGAITVYTGFIFIQSEKAMGFVKKYAPYLLMAGVLFFAYYPVLTGYYLHTDDYYFMKWGNFSQQIVRYATITGRPLQGFLYLLCVRIGSLAWMNLLRFLSVCSLCVAACLLFRWLCAHKCHRWFSAFLSAAVFTLPPFQVYASFVCVGFPDAIAMIFGILALMFVHRADTRSAPIFYNLAAILFLVMSFSFYQPGACLYLSLLVVPLLAEKDIGSFVFWRKIFVYLSVFAVAVLVYYLPWRVWLDWAAIPSCANYDGRLFVPDVGQRWIWFIKGPLIDATNFWNIHPLRSVSYVFMGFVGMALLCRLRMKNLGFDLIRYCVVLLLIPASFFIILVSSAPSMNYRTYPALSATLLLVGILSLVFSEKVKYRLSLAGLTFLVMIGGACWAHETVEDYFAGPDSKEIRYIIETIRDAQANGQADFSGIALVMPRHPFAPDKRGEIGEPSTTAPQNIRPVLMWALHELGIKKNIRVDIFEDMANLYLHEYGVMPKQSGLLPKVVYREDVIIDMTKIDD